MPHYQTFDPNAELQGQTVLAFITNIEHDDIENILVQHQLDQVDPSRWYDLQAVLNVLTDISGDVNASERLVAIGMAASRLSLKVLPPEYANVTPEQWLQAYSDRLYNLRHRNGYVGKITLRKENANHLVLTTQIPYPDDLMYGVFYEYIRHFCPPTHRFVLGYDPQSKRRDDGGEYTNYHISFSPSAN